MGKLPTIVHRGVVVTETAAIIAYIADAFPAAGLAPPPGDPLRGAYYRWLFFGAGCFEPALLDKMMNRPPVERKAAVGWGSYEEVLATLKTALANGPLPARRQVQRRRCLYRLGDPLRHDVRRARPEGREGVRRLRRAPVRPSRRASAPPEADSRSMATSTTNRRLATILFADVDGYSRLMRADEESTLVDLRAHLAELVAPVVERFHGRIVKTVGDGVLVEFGSAIEAVRSAVELQRGMVERNAGTPADRRQAFRIGLHLGDIIVSDEDVFGDTVNVASRLRGPGRARLDRAVGQRLRAGARQARSAVPRPRARAR